MLYLYTDADVVESIDDKTSSVIAVYLTTN